MTDNKITREMTFSEELPYFKERMKEISDNYDNPDGYADVLYLSALSDSNRIVRKAEEEINRQQEEIDRLTYNLWGVMHSVDKWLDGDELKQDEVNRAATMREKTLQIVENLQSENERLEKEIKDKERAYNDEFCLRKEWKTKCQELLEEKQTARSEAYKECLANVKNYIKTNCNPYGKPTFDYDTSIAIMRYIDNLVKEMESESNE